MLSFLLHFFFLHSSLKPWQLLVTMRNDILWRCSIFQPLPILTPSWEQNVPGVLPAEALSAPELAPSHACTPGMQSHSTGCVSATSYVPGPLFLSGTGPSSYKSNYLHKLSLKPRGINSVYQNTPLLGENGQNLCCTKIYVLLSYIYHGSWVCLRQQHHHCVHSPGWVGMRFPCICIFFHLEDYMGI